MEKFIGNSKEKFMYHNTLLCLVKSLQDCNITVDLRNDTCVCGKLVSVDGFMNLSFKNCVFCDPCGNEYYFDDLFIQGRNIRYVHIPESMSTLSRIRQQFTKQKPQAADKPTVQSRKAKKALKQHLETVAFMNSSNTQSQS